MTCDDVRVQGRELKYSSLGLIGHYGKDISVASAASADVFAKILGKMGKILRIFDG